MLGVLINVITVIIGSSIGLLFKKGIPEKVSHAAMVGLGACTVYIGITGSLSGENVLILIAAVVLGAIIGTLLNIDGGISALAEKVETILRRGVFNTRPRDFYDAYILATTQAFDKALFAEALKATAARRGTTEQIADISTIIKNIEESTELRAMWDKYRKRFAYAEGITYESIIAVLEDIIR